MQAEQVEQTEHQPIDRERLLDLWASGAPASSIAVECDCSPSSIYRITKEAFEFGDQRGAPQTQEARDLYRANLHMQKIADLARKGLEVSAIASKYGLPDHVVRAAIYLATKAGLSTGFVLGA